MARYKLLSRHKRLSPTRAEAPIEKNISGEKKNVPSSWRGWQKFRYEVDRDYTTVTKNEVSPAVGTLSCNLPYISTCIIIIIIIIMTDPINILYMSVTMVGRLLHSVIASQYKLEDI
jgi:hypothetical protein